MLIKRLIILASFICAASAFYNEPKPKIKGKFGNHLGYQSKKFIEAERGPKLSIQDVSKVKSVTTKIKTALRKSEKKYFSYIRQIFPDDYTNITATDEEENEEHFNGRILAEPGEYPHMAALGYRDNISMEITFRCGGSLISENFIVTAAHCTEDNFPPNLVKLGSVDLTRINSTIATTQVRQISRIINHPSYNATMLQNDIALVQLDSKIELSEFVRPLRLWVESGIPLDNAYTMGFGTTEFAGRQTYKLTDLSMTIMSNEQCNKILAVDLGGTNITESQICAIDYQQNRDTCQGDSGGPLQLNMKGQKRGRKHYFLIGIVSYGVFCRSRNPSVYTRTSFYVKWIEDNVWPQ